MYTTVTDANGAVRTASRLAAAQADAGSAAGLASALPALVERVMAEAGLVEVALAERALRQSAGDSTRAVSLLRAWAANLPRLEHTRVGRADLRPRRRITPAWRAPAGGQFLGATMDYAPRMLEFADPAQTPPVLSDPSAAAEGDAPMGVPPRSLDALMTQGLVAEPSPAEPTDRTRTHLGAGAGRGALLQHLARADTGAMTALAYSSMRGFAEGADPTLVELLRAGAPVHRTHPVTGERVEIGEVTITTAEVALYRISGGQPDPRFTVGFGATVGTVEVRAIAAALLDGATERARRHGPSICAGSAPADDEEFVLLTLDQSEANGFIEHLKLPHHVTFASDVDALRRARAGADLGEESIARDPADPATSAGAD